MATVKPVKLSKFSILIFSPLDVVLSSLPTTARVLLDEISPSELNVVANLQTVDNYVAEVRAVFRHIAGDFYRLVMDVGGQLYKYRGNTQIIISSRIVCYPTDLLSFCRI